MTITMRKTHTDPFKKDRLPKAHYIPTKKKAANITAINTISNYENDNGQQTTHNKIDQQFIDKSNTLVNEILDTTKSLDLEESWPSSARPLNDETMTPTRDEREVRQYSLQHTSDTENRFTSTKPELSTASILNKYIERFRTGEAQSREERRVMSADSSKDFWWLQSADQSQTVMPSDTCVSQKATTNKNQQLFDKSTESLQTKADELLSNSLSSEGCVSTEGLGSTSTTGSATSKTSEKPVRPSFTHTLHKVVSKESSFPKHPLTSDADDILYQWRLRRKMELARSTAEPSKMNLRQHGQILSNNHNQDEKDEHKLLNTRKDFINDIRSFKRNIKDTDRLMDLSETSERLLNEYNRQDNGTKHVDNVDHLSVYRHNVKENKKQSIVTDGSISPGLSNDQGITETPDVSKKENSTLNLKNGETSCIRQHVDAKTQTAEDNLGMVSGLKNDAQLRCRDRVVMTELENYCHYCSQFKAENIGNRFRTCCGCESRLCNCSKQCSCDKISFYKCSRKLCEACCKHCCYKVTKKSSTNVASDVISHRGQGDACSVDSAVLVTNNCSCVLKNRFNDLSSSDCMSSNKVFFCRRSSDDDQEHLDEHCLMNRNLNNSQDVADLVPNYRILQAEKPDESGRLHELGLENVLPASYEVVKEGTNSNGGTDNEKNASHNKEKDKKKLAKDSFVKENSLKGHSVKKQDNPVNPNNMDIIKSSNRKQLHIEYNREIVPKNDEKSNSVADSDKINDNVRFQNTHKISGNKSTTKHGEVIMVSNYNDGHNNKLNSQYSNVQKNKAKRRERKLSNPGSISDASCDVDSRHFDGTKTLTDDRSNAVVTKAVNQVISKQLFDLSTTLETDLSTSSDFTSLTPLPSTQASVETAEANNLTDTTFAALSPLSSPDNDFDDDPILRILYSQQLHLEDYLKKIDTCLVERNSETL